MITPILKTYDEIYESFYLKLLLENQIVQLNNFENSENQIVKIVGLKNGMQMDELCKKNFTHILSYKNKNPFCKYDFVNCKREGLGIEWFSNGNVHHKRNYTNGKLNGPSINYYPNGFKHIERHFIDNKILIGKFKGYSKFGELEIDINWERSNISSLLRNFDPKTDIDHDYYYVDEDNKYYHIANKTFIKLHCNDVSLLYKLLKNN